MPKVQVALVSPSSLENYANCLVGGFRNLDDVEITSRVAPPSLRPTEDPSGTMSFIQESAAGADVVITQLHGAHNEIPVVFSLWKYLQPLKVPLIVIVHRPEEVLERHSRGLYTDELSNSGGASVIDIMSGCGACVLLGEASRPDYDQALRKPVQVIPHGFFNCLENAPAEPFAGGVAVVGSVTTWSDMRWLSDIFALHSACGAEAAGAERANSLLFVAAGTFRPFTIPGQSIAVDELGDLQAELQKGDAASHPAVIVQGREIEEACGTGSVTDQASLRRWLWRLSDEGRKVCVIASLPSSSGSGTAAVLIRGLIDFNCQLYRELLRGFAPKIEYSGTLHEQPGSSIPIVFDSPSMTDVASEGLCCLLVPPSLSNEKLSASAGGSSPDFTGAATDILRLSNDPESFNGMREVNAAAGAQLGFDTVAKKYEELIDSLLV